ncbi:phytanoyl-CoA dioxygenase family protein [Pedobacter caeni]|uniref:Ectoine hydroxylase-related dioxygenase, phytanoyl-CoA dioxygenase (PhyH) family n=1 Tax=Pedobacter caeni TaxID=288992 RepID=A0A1M5GFD0_9SPHI|nr:phytanoyl-CoA dioxygenase family protein [Pedobacter caeni]SHG02434.1 Ectoine hydroxylase-related dioxygenase, phytanoyl-CoA dioxygenase (PhyH) family [Pedobacter caeni]
MENRLDYALNDLGLFDEVIWKYGWIVYENALDPQFVEDIKQSLQPAYEYRRKIQLNNGIAESMDGTLHHLVEKELFSLKFLEQKYGDPQIRHFLNGQYILNSLGAVINLKNSQAYVQNVHRDIRTFTGSFKLMIQMMVILDDFTLENGATYFLSGSHQQDEKPEADYFYAHADRALAKKGSIILFDANLWHAAGKNNTDEPRRALTMAFTKPFMKQQMDYPRFLGYAFGESLTEDLKQVIGYNSRVPADFEEYYQPVHKRMYQRGQE